MVTIHARAHLFKSECQVLIGKTNCSIAQNSKAQINVRGYRLTVLCLRGQVNKQYGQTIPTPYQCWGGGGLRSKKDRYWRSTTLNAMNNPQKSISSDTIITQGVILPHVQSFSCFFAIRFYISCRLVPAALNMIRWKELILLCYFDVLYIPFRTSVWPPTQH